MSAIQTSDASPAGASGDRHCGSHPGQRWYCVGTHPGREYEVTGRLLAQGFKPYLPIKVTYAADDPAGKLVTMFPRYLFVRFDLVKDRWRPIAHTRGVLRIIGQSAERPTPVPEGIVERIQARGRAGDGAIDARQPAFPPIEPGSEVRIISGPFADIDAICFASSRTRVRLLMELMGATREVEFQRSQVEPI